MAASINVGRLRTLMTVQSPGATVPDGDGGFTQTPVATSPPTWRVSIAKASQRSGERLFASTVLAHATHIVSGRYNSTIVPQMRLTWTDRSGRVHQANVLDVDDTDGAGIETVALIGEIIAVAG